MIRRIFFSFFIVFCACGASYADVASAQYVQASVKSKVDTDKEANQELAGHYIITGVLEVPDAPLPSAD